MRKLGYSLVITTGLLFGTITGAQGTSQTPDMARQTNAPAQPQSGCSCGMMGHGMGGAGMHCPMHGMADVKVEETPTGAVLRLTAKNPGQVSEVQRMAEGMQRCMSGSGTPPQGQPPSSGQQQR
jgi:hypothetical protein